MAALTELERARIRRHLGYQSWANLALAWGFSFPTGVEPQFYVNDAMNRLTDEGLELVREDMRQCDAIESQLKDSIKRLKAAKVGDITLNPDEPDALRGELRKWRDQLANDFGAFINPFKHESGGSGSRNGTCVG